MRVPARALQGRVVKYCPTSYCLTTGIPGTDGYRALKPLSAVMPPAARNPPHITRFVQNRVPSGRRPVLSVIARGSWTRGKESRSFSVHWRRRRIFMPSITITSAITNAPQAARRGIHGASRRPSYGLALPS